MKIAAGIVFLFFTSVLASPGDNHYVYQSCLQHCQQINCTTEFSLSEFYQEQPFFESLLQWTCSDECSYRCMWQTVDVLQRKRQSIVQFHGKKFSLRIQEIVLLLIIPPLSTSHDFWSWVYNFMRAAAHSIADIVFLIDCNFHSCTERRSEPNQRRRACFFSLSCA